MTLGCIEQHVLYGALCNILNRCESCIDQLFNTHNFGGNSVLFHTFYYFALCLCSMNVLECREDLSPPVLHHICSSHLFSLFNVAL